MLVKVFRVAQFSGRKLNCFRRRPTAETTWRPTKLEVPAWGGIIDIYVAKGQREHRCSPISQTYYRLITYSRNVSVKWKKLHALKLSDEMYV